MRWLAPAAVVAGLWTAAASRDAGRRQALEPKEEFSAAAAQALVNLSAEFARFRGALAGRTNTLAATLQDQERGNRELELSNARETQAVGDLRRSNGALRARGRALSAANEQLRAELREAKAKLQEAQDFSSQSIEGDHASEAALLAGADAPPVVTTAAPEPMAAPEAAETEALPQARADAPALQALQQQAPQRQEPQRQEPRPPPPPVQATTQGPPPLQGVLPTAAPAGQLDGDVGYAEAFASGDADGSSEEFGESQAEDEDASPFESLLALRSHRSRLRKQRSLADDLPQSAEAFAKLEEESASKVQRLFRSAQEHVQQRRAKLFAKQGSLNATREVLEATHRRLATVVAKLEATNHHLEAHTQRLLTLLGHMASTAREAEAHAAAALAANPQPQSSGGATAPTAEAAAPGAGAAARAHAAPAG